MNYQTYWHACCGYPVPPRLCLHHLMVLALLRFSEAVEHIKPAMMINVSSVDYRLHLNFMVVWEYYSVDSNSASFSDLEVLHHPLQHLWRHLNLEELELLQSEQCRCWHPNFILERCYLCDRQLLAHICNRLYFLQAFALLLQGHLVFQDGRRVVLVQLLIPMELNHEYLLLL